MSLSLLNLISVIFSLYNKILSVVYFMSIWIESDGSKFLLPAFTISFYEITYFSARARGGFLLNLVLLGPS